jgi:hypothetical protein
MSTMIPDTFTPFKVTTPARARGCFTCSSFQGRYYGGHVVCERTKAPHMIGVPAYGVRVLGAGIGCR